MSDVNLLVFGCVVSFIALAAGYVYVRESFTAQEPPRKVEVNPEEALPADPRELA
jgi:hypothetical protein